MKKGSISVMMCTVIVALSFFFLTLAPAMAETMAGERGDHPRIAKAINAIEDAIAYMKAAPHDFGGHRVQAIADSEKALKELKEALKYRETKDNKRMKR